MAVGTRAMTEQKRGPSRRRGGSGAIPRGNSVFMHFFGVFLVWFFLWRFLSASHLVQVVMLVAAACGAWIVLVVGRQPWGASRGRWLQPIGMFFVPLYFASAGFGLDSANRIVVATYFGLVVC